MGPTAPPFSEDDFDAQARRIRRRILDGIEATLDEWDATALPVALQAAIASAVASPVPCSRAACRRAGACRAKRGARSRCARKPVPGS